MVLRRTTKSVDGTIPVQALLYNDEEICATQEGVGMYDGTQKSPNHQAGTVVVTTHRLFYIDARKAYDHSFSLDLSFVTQTDYYAGLFKSSPKVTLHLSGNSYTSTQESDDDDQTSSIIKISFRKGGVKEFYAVLKRSLKGKMWESNGIGTSTWSSESTLGTDRGTVGRSGITGILQNVEISAQGRETGMQDALQDLEALMVKAKDMVRLAAELNEKLTAATAETQSFASPVSPTEPEEATFIRSSLSQLGLQMSNAPVTLDMIKDERQWTEELARELAQILQGSSSSTPKESGMMKSRGIIALDEVWGGWNRARGVALIPPSTFLLVLPQLPLCTDPPIQTRTFASGLRVLHTPIYTHAAFSARFSSMLALTGPKTTTQVAQEEGMTLGLSAEMISAVEEDGDICRDDPAGYSWDGQDD
ncbi:hypothetical protein DXG03_003062 [Asterophora parasitica]|uniref:Vacuolar protein-sorting-associated protein 36 n=1 Tax=Asterophora parasitica TaxID=117018 RepID=A0A9P7KAV5_9AGAR|nr:hypothetical protein DXG03_003062 [Asterophora parasitica]